MLAPILQQQQQQQNGSNSNGSIASTSNGYGHHRLLNGDRQQHLQQQQQQQPKLFSYKLVQLQHSYTGLPFGFTNEGNYCYMISVLQSLLHTPAFINFVLSSHVSTCRIVPSVDKWCAVCEFVRYYKRYSCGPGSACYPRAFMNRLSAISPTMRLNRQEDAHEFLRGLLDYMESNCLHGYTGAESKRASNPIRVLFCGKLKSSVLCSKCGAQSQTFDDFMDLSLCIQSSNNLIDCLQRFVSADLLKDSNAYKCEKCRTKVTAMKSFSIAVGPPILTIQLNRFQWGHNSKISRFVEFPLSLDLRPFMSKRGRPVQYDLYSVVIHHGASTKFGHYYCYAKRNEAWWCLNDASVERISETRVLNSCPYILFYRRTDLSALVNNNSNSSNGARPVSTVDAPHPTPPIAAAPPIPVSSIPTSQTAAVRSIPSTSTIRVLVSSAASPIQSTITSTTSSGPMFTPRPVFVLRNNSSNGNCNGNGSVSSGSSTSSGSKTDLLQFMSARNVNSSCYSSKSNNGSTSDSTAQAAAAQSGNSELLVSYGSPSQSPSHSSASAAASPSSTCIRLKIHKVEGNKFSCVPVPLQQQQQQQKQQLVMQLTPPQPTKSVVASASAPVDARASARTPPPSYQLPAASNSEPQQQQRHQQSSSLKRKASQDQSSSSPSSSEYDWVECCSGPAAAAATAAAASAAAAHSAHNSAKEDCNSDSDEISSSSDRETAKKRSKRHHHQQHDRHHSRRQNHHKRHKRKSSHHKSRRRSSSRSHRHNHHNQ
ncbi:hypothetical protein BOX15_Mlig003458g3 [Macrostomum lignano]|uniref:Ubiquitin carboxyl-terminal hydrolase 36 n=1 Tax=Macrostomum lignano TaxID=282301 RepID=A0A267G9N3_9PLAT|nr:hypothetical protein BOX15_Mlig003458g3 [Macrostomum lignano]